MKETKIKKATLYNFDIEVQNQTIFLEKWFNRKKLLTPEMRAIDFVKKITNQGLWLNKNTEFYPAHSIIKVTLIEVENRYE